jgi:hypothetical protein
MILRNYNSNDFLQIKRLYQDCLNFDMDELFYDYLYKAEDDYQSVVCVIDDQIVGHNAIIKKDYLYKENLVKIGLSSGGMVSNLYSGVFYNILKYSFNKFEGDGIIAFPNGNSIKFFSKIFKFNVISDNYFYLTHENLLIPNDHKEQEAGFRLSPFCFKYRLDHPRNTYKSIKIKNCEIIYKSYKDEADLLFVSSFGKGFIDCLKHIFLEGFFQLNLISNNIQLVTSFGFVKKKNNSFVYKWENSKYQNFKFPCQMIDSDVF